VERGKGNSGIIHAEVKTTGYNLKKKKKRLKEKLAGSRAKRGVGPASAGVRQESK